MKGLTKTFIFLISCLFITSCGLFKGIPVETHYRDSVVVSIKDSTVIKDSVVLVPVPKEEVINITMPNQTSHLLTSLAESTAYTDSLGFLHHTLRNRNDQVIPVVVFNTEKYHKAEALNSKSESLTRTVQVEKKLNWWQKFRLKSFWVLLLALILENVIIIFAINKRFIFK